MPSGALGRLVACGGDRLAVEASGLPPDTYFELWQAYRGQRRAECGVIPFDDPQMRLGQVRSDGQGRVAEVVALEAFEDPPEIRQRIWLVYPGRETAVIIDQIQCLKPVEVRGTLYDDAGRLFSRPVKVEVSVHLAPGHSDAPYVVKEARAQDGRFEVREVPAPAHMWIRVLDGDEVLAERKLSEWDVTVQWEDPFHPDPGNLATNFWTPVTFDFGGPQGGVDRTKHEHPIPAQPS